jgi:hypothetical protein
MIRASFCFENKDLFSFEKTKLKKGIDILHLLKMKLKKYFD